MWIVLFSKVACTPLKDRVSTILPPVVGMEKKKKLLSSYHCSNSDEYNILFYFKTLALPVVNRGEPPPPTFILRSASGTAFLHTIRNKRA